MKACLALPFILALLAACAHREPHAAPTRDVAAESRSSAETFPVIDVHIHTDFDDENDDESAIPYAKAELLREMKEAGVVGAVSHSPRERWSKVEDLRAHGIVHCAGLPAKPNLAELEQGLKSGRFGCIKVYLGYVHQYASDKNYLPAYRLAEKYDVPVVFHTGDTHSAKAKLKYADPLTVDEVAVDFPNVTFVIAHCGNPWIQSAAEVAYKNPNVYIEGSAFLIGDLSRLSRDEVDELMVKPLAYVFKYIEDPKKLMFGSDWPLVNIKAYVDAYKRAIPREHWKAVFHDNAVQVFKFKK